MATLTLQPDSTTGIDTYLRENAGDTASGDSTALFINSNATNRRRAFIKFDVTSIAGATVSSATLTMTADATLVGARTGHVHAVLTANSAWAEGSTWNYLTPSTVRWAGDVLSDGGTDAGCSVTIIDYNSTEMGSWSVANNDPVDTQYVITLSASQIQAWVDGANYGLVLFYDSASNINHQYASCEHATSTRRPKLEVVYTAAAKAPPLIARPLRIWNKRRIA